MNETDILTTIRNKLNRRTDVRCWRNNVGTLRDERGTYVSYGLCVGSSDLIGYVVRDGRAIFLAIECKSVKGRVSPEQENFLRVVREAGGLAGVARTVEDAERIVAGGMK